MADDSRNAYVFERAVHFQNGDGTNSIGRIDLYKKDCFVLEAKQGSDQVAPSMMARSRRGTAVPQTPGWDEAMLAARNQAERYAKDIPEDWPPLLITIEVGFSIELFADFSLTGRIKCSRNCVRGSTLPDRVRAIRTALSAEQQPLGLPALSQMFASGAAAGC